MVLRDDNNLTLTVTSKQAAAKKMKLTMTGYYQGKYLYTLSRSGLIMTYKEYGISKNKTFWAKKLEFGNFLMQFLKMNRIKKSYVKKSKLYLGGKKQKGGFSGAFAKNPFGVPFGKEILGLGKKRENT